MRRAWSVVRGMERRLDSSRTGDPGGVWPLVNLNAN